MTRFSAFILFTTISLVTTCLITNCPKGGKRGRPLSPNGNKDEPTAKDHCIRCGPGLAGRCLGPALCCGPRLGCLLASPVITSQCEGVNLPSLPRGQVCFSHKGLGTCASDGVCCSSDTCRIDMTCEMDTYTDVCSLEEIPQTIK